MAGLKIRQFSKKFNCQGSCGKLQRQDQKTFSSVLLLKVIMFQIGTISIINDILHMIQFIFEVWNVD